MKDSTFHSRWLDWEKPETPNLRTDKTDKSPSVSSVSSLPRGFSPKEGFHRQVEEWIVRRIEIPSQSVFGSVDIWMCAERTDGVQQIRFWFAGSEDSTHGVVEETQEVLKWRD